MFATESDWFINNWDSVDYFKSSSKSSDPEILTTCSSCGNPTHNPSSDHFFLEGGMVLCEVCYLDYCLMNYN